MLRQIINTVLIVVLSACHAQTPMPQHTNALADETSPYLLQHAHNPVDWHPWGQTALAKAQATDKLMIISIGYAACHWCHVMERESFEDSTVAAVMNENFVPVKVDREERPDVDDVYMTACHLTSGGSCGWPLNAIALPDGRPIWAGTYFPKKKWIEILEYFTDLRAKEPEKLEAYARQVEQQLATSSAQPPLPDMQGFDAELPRLNSQRIVMLSDSKYGGLAGAPKFPMPVIYHFMLTEAAVSQDSTRLDVVFEGLDAMARGGIFDQLGGGFARYSTDAAWHAPHFEKMLYDNGQLLSLYSRAYRMSEREEYADLIHHTIAFIERELTSPSGTFYSSLDADSEGEEGKFYVWTHDELAQLLTPEELKAYEVVYDVSKRGNWEHGVNILHRQGDWVRLSAKLKMTPEALQQVLAKADKKLMAARDKRIRPGLDDKILVSWNGLMIKGLADAYLATGKHDYLNMAARAARAVEETFLQSDGRLLRTHAKGKTHINAFLDDYANLADAYLALYQSNFDKHWLDKATQLVDYALAHFSNPEGALLYYTSDLDPALVARRVEDSDNVIPSSNSVMAHNLLTLGSILGREDYVERAEAMAATVLPSLAAVQQPAYWSRWLEVHTLLANRRYEVAIVGPDARAKRLAMARQLLPQAVFVGGDTEQDLELLEGKLQEGQTMIYVCENRVCQLPTPEVAKALSLIR